MIAEYQQPITIDKLYSYLLSMLLWFLFHVSYWRSHIGGGFLRLNVRCVGIQDIKVFEPDSWFTVRCLYPVVTTLVNDVDGPYGRSAEDNHIILWPVDSVCLFLFFYIFHWKQIFLPNYSEYYVAENSYWSMNRHGWWSSGKCSLCMRERIRIPLKSLNRIVSVSLPNTQQNG